MNLYNYKYATNYYKLIKKTLIICFIGNFLYLMQKLFAIDMNNKFCNINENLLI